MDRRQALKGIATLAGAAALPLPGVPAAMAAGPTTIRVIGITPFTVLPKGAVIDFGGDLYECVEAHAADENGEAVMVLRDCEPD